jgi:hypothetical protein
MKSEKLILGFYFITKMVHTCTYICCLFAYAHNSLSSRLPSGRAPNLLPPHLPWARRGRRVNEDSIQIYLNTMALINLNAFGVAGAHVQIYLLISDHGWFQGYIIRTCILGICDVETEGNCCYVFLILDSNTQQLPRATVAFGTSSTFANFLYKMYKEKKLFFKKHWTGFKFS